jgi:hypothetical protein
MIDGLHVGCIDQLMEHGWKRDKFFMKKLARVVRVIHWKFPGLEAEVTKCCFCQVTRCSVDGGKLDARY